MIFVSAFIFFVRRRGVAGCGSSSGIAGVSSNGIGTSQSAAGLPSNFCILQWHRHMANQVPSGSWFCLLAVFEFVMLVLGCHNVIYFNHATFVLTTVLYGNDGNAWYMENVCLGAYVRNLGCLVYVQKLSEDGIQVEMLKDVQDISFSGVYQKSVADSTLGVCLSMLVGELLDGPGRCGLDMEAMSVLQPFAYRSNRKIICDCFLANSGRMLWLHVIDSDTSREQLWWGIWEELV